MKFEIIQLTERNRNVADFPMDLVYPFEPVKKPISIDIDGNIITIEVTRLYVGDCAICPLYKIGDAYSPTSVIGKFLLQLQELDYRIKEVVAVFSYDETEFGIIGFRV